MELTDLQFAVEQQKKIDAFEEYIANICTLIHHPNGAFAVPVNDNVNFIMDSIIKMGKELKELREFKTAVIKAVSEK